MAAEEWWSQPATKVFVKYGSIPVFAARWKDGIILARLTSRNGGGWIATGGGSSSLGSGGNLACRFADGVCRARIAGRVSQRSRRTRREVSEKISAEEMAERVDRRDLPFVTIDPIDAKDFDDAICAEALPEGRFRLGVAIADVSHFVSQGDPIDQEALLRGTSVYIPGKTIPMLPERLSNGLCSLRPHEDRLAKVAWMEADLKGNFSTFNLRRR